MFRVITQTLLYTSTCNRADQSKINQYNNADQTGKIESFIKNNVLTIPCGVQELGCQIFFYDKRSELTNIVIPDTVTKIRDNNNCSEYYNYGGVFNDCSGLKSLVIPDSVTYIGTVAFSSCTNLEEIKLPSGITQISTCAFQNCISLKTINLPSSLQKIDNLAFFGCTGLTHITIPERVSLIENQAFRECTSLRTIKLPSGLRQIIMNTFEGCKSLLSVTIPPQVETISTDAFSGCTNLLTVTIPKSVYRIDGGAFGNCVNLNSVCFGGCSCYINQRAFRNTIFDELTSVYQFNKTCPSMFYVCTDLSKQFFAFENGTKYCINDENVIYYQIINDTVKEYIKECPKNYHINNQIPYQCVNKCTNGYAQQESTYQCSDNCQYYINNDNTWICSTSCPEDYKYQVLLERVQCTKSCDHPVYKFANDHSDPKQCLKDCDYYWYQYDENTKKCTENNNCLNVQNYQEIIYDKMQQSNKQCVDICNKQYWYKQDDQTNICTKEDSCENIIINDNVLSSLEYDNSQCITSDECTSYENYYEFEGDTCTVFKSITQCSQLSEYQGFEQYIKQSTTSYKCAQDCLDENVWYMSPFKQYTCLNKCVDQSLYGYEIERKECLQFDICQASNHFVMIYENNLYFCKYKQNIENCAQYKDVKGFSQYIYQENNYCVEQCSYFWYYYNEEIIKCTQRDTCNDAKNETNQELIQLDVVKRQCIEQQDCSKQDEFFYVYFQGNCTIIEDVDSCYELAKLNNYTSYIYQLSDTKECVSKCPYNYYQFAENIYICTKDSSCEDETLDKVNEQTHECIEQCPENIWKLEDEKKVCLTIDQCKQYQQNQQIIIDAKTKECLNITYDPKNDTNQIIVNNTVYVYENITDCDALSEMLNIILFESQTDQKCLTKCPDDYMWFYNSNNKPECIESCKVQNLQGIELKSSKCVSVEYCEEQEFALQLDLEHIQCQYVENATSCQVYGQFEKTKQYVVKEQYQNKCTDCSDTNMKVETENNEMVCKLRNEMFNQQKQNLGLIVGLSIVGVAIIISLAVMIHINADKKKILKKKAEIQKQRQGYINHIQYQLQNNSHEMTTVQQNSNLDQIELGHQPKCNSSQLDNFVESENIWIN